MKSFVVYDFMIKDLKLKGYELLIYSVIHSFTSLGQRCYVSVRKFSNLLGCSIKQVKRCLSKLQDKNLILFRGYYHVVNTNVFDCSVDRDDIHDADYDWESILSE